MKKQLIGRGAFSTVYRISKSKVLISSRDNVKECMGLGWFPKSPMFPSIKCIDFTGERKLYTSRYYPKVTSLRNTLDTREYEFYKVLRALERGRGYAHWYAQFQGIPPYFKGKKKVLQSALDSLANYGDDVCFEISPRNVAVHKGKLILLDCFYFDRQL